MESEGIKMAHHSVRISKYQQIAVDIANKIVEKAYKEGDKIQAKSHIASRYHVSAETARRALLILADLDIVEIKHGSGAYIKSYDNAIKFINQYKEVQSISDLHADIKDSLKKQADENHHLYELVGDLLDQTKRFQTIHPLTPFQLEIHAPTPYIGKTIQEMNLWQNTAATLIAIKHEEELVISPGPYAKFEENDIIYFIGNEFSLQRVTNFLYPEKAE